MILDKDVQDKLAQMFERIIQEYGDSPELRLAIAQYTMGYMGVGFGLHIPQ